MHLYLIMLDYMLFIYVEEFVLESDVLLHNRIDELLNYNCWLASDDVRYIVTGLRYGEKIIS